LSRRPICTIRISQTRNFQTLPTFIPRKLKLAGAADT
jgi:hypothetical protein